MTEFKIRAWYTGPSAREFTCTVEKETRQIMEIRVPSNRSSLLLWTDYPTIYNARKKKGAKWQIKEGSFDVSTLEKRRLLNNIFSALEGAIKTYLDGKRQQELGFQ